MSGKTDAKVYSIGEAGKIAGLEPHVLRFWETEFDELAPVKNEAGRRVYREEDIAVVLKLKELLHEKKFTIEGAKKILHGEKNLSHLQTQFSFDDEECRKTLRQVRDELLDIIKLLD